MKTSELIRRLSAAITEFGDLDILVRDCSNGYDYDCASVSGDPASDAEKDLGIKGTIDLNVWCANGREPYIKFGMPYSFTRDGIKQSCIVMRMCVDNHAHYGYENIYIVRLIESGEITAVLENELSDYEIEWQAPDKGEK